MGRRRWVRAAALVVGIGVLTAGCSTIEDVLSGDDVSVREAQVVLLIPETDGAAPAGVQASVDLAQQQWDDIPGWNVEVVLASDIAADTAAEPDDDTGDDTDDGDPASQAERTRETATEIAEGDAVAVIEIGRAHV